MLALALAFVTALGISWMRLPNIALAHEKLLGKVSRTSEHEPVIVDILRIADHTNQFSTWLGVMSGFGYPVLFLLVVGALARLSAHPRPGFFAIVLSRSLADLLHLGFVALILFLVLAATSLLVLGPFLESYATFSSALSTQLRWLFCEFLTDVAMPMRLPISCRSFYYVYAVGFVLLANWFLLFLVPAVLLHAFGTLRADANDCKHHACACAGSFDSDVVGVLSARFNGSWPLRCELASVLANAPLEESDPRARGTLDFGELRRHMPVRWRSEVQKHQELQKLVMHYEKSIGGFMFLPLEKSPPEAECDQDKEWPFANIPFLDLRGNQLVRVRVRRVVLDLVAEAERDNLDWEQVATTMSCLAIQEVDQCVPANRAPAKNGKSTKGVAVPKPDSAPLAREKSGGAEVASEVAAAPMDSEEAGPKDTDKQSVISDESV
jgi:hypothetical protein